jgi:outer membrane protein assembly factor BamB
MADAMATPTPQRRRAGPHPLRAAVLLCVASVAMSGCWWLQPGHDARRSGHNPTETRLTRENVATLTEAWSATVGAAEVRDPAMSADGVHAVSGVEVRTYRLWDGAERWATRVLPPDCPPEDCEAFAAVGAPSVRGGQVLVPAFVAHGDQPRLGNAANVFDPSTGERLDRLDAGASPDSVTVDGDTLAATSAVYCGQCYAATLTVFDQSDPPSGWRTVFPETSVATPPTFADDRVVFGLGGRRVAAYTVAPPTNCHPDFPICPPLWTYGLQGDATPPVVSDDGGTVYVGDTAGTVTALAASDGRLLWSAQLGGTSVLAAPTSGNGLLYVPSSDGRVSVFDADGCGAATCAPVWTAATGSAVTTQAALAGGVLHVASDDGTIRAFDAAGCGAAACPAIWETSTGSRITGAPTVASGNLLVGTADGRLIVYRPS